MKISKFIRRSAEELSATVQVARYVGIGNALKTLQGKIEIQKMCRDGYQESDARKEILLSKHEIMLRYFRKRYGDFFSSYDFAAPVPDDDSPYREKVWACWWQGEQNAPEIAKACLKSIRQAANGHEVIVLDDTNYRQYANLPDWIVDKYNRGVISRTQFSDVLRFALLAEHGGIWLDSTIFCSAQLPEDAFARPLFTISRPDCDHMSVAAGRFSDFCIGCSYDSRRIFVAIRDAYYLYWNTNDYLIDYLTNDYMIVLLQLYDPNHIGRVFNEVIPSNPELGKLLVLLNEPFDEKQWDELSATTSIFKLSWKIKCGLETKDGKPTFYSALLEGKLL